LERNKNESKNGLKRREGKGCGDVRKEAVNEDRSVAERRVNFWSQQKPLENGSSAGEVRIGELSVKSLLR
jgi:hypothetical protein